MRNRLFGLIIILALSACGGKNNAPAPAPGVPVLLTPAQNEICTSGTIVSATESSIQFTWQAADNASTYEVDIKNLLTSSVTTQTTTSPGLSVTLLRNTPYSWYVVAKSSKTTKTGQSSTWKFYNAGNGTVSYAPYPADLTAPTFGQIVTTSTVELDWQGSSVSNNITGYSVYFGKSSNPPLLKSGITDSFLKNIAVDAASTYYWHIITIDATGDYSDSGIYQFSTK